MKNRQLINDFLEAMAQFQHVSQSIERILHQHEEQLLTMAEREIGAIDEGLRMIGEMRERFGRSGLLVPTILQTMREAENAYLEQRTAQMSARDSLRTMLGVGGELPSAGCPRPTEKGGAA